MVWNRKLSNRIWFSAANADSPIPHRTSSVSVAVVRSSLSHAHFVAPSTRSMRNSAAPAADRSVLPSLARLLDLFDNQAS